MRLLRLLQSFEKLDDPPHRVKPLPIPILQALLRSAYSEQGSPLLQCIADMCCIAYFYLCRPGEYSAVNEESVPFRLCDVQFLDGCSVYHKATTTDLPTILSAAGSSLTFTTQKNGVRGEVIASGTSGDPLCCGTGALKRRVAHLRTHNAPTTSPLAVLYSSHSPPFALRSTDITAALRSMVTAFGAPMGLAPREITSRSLRAGGAQALLCARVDTDEIKLLGRWKSDAMLRYLSAQALPVMDKFAQCTLTGGHFTVTPNLSVPMF